MKSNKRLADLGKRTIYTLAIGNFSFPPTRDQKKVVEMIKEFKGFLAIHPAYPHGTLLFFDTLNNAKEARNIFRSEGVKTGNNIMEAEFDFVTYTMHEGRKVA